MSPPTNVLICLFLVSVMRLTACAPSEPIIPPDEAVGIKEKLGYVLAPTWMPEYVQLPH